MDGATMTAPTNDSNAPPAFPRLAVATTGGDDRPRMGDVWIAGSTAYLIVEAATLGVVARNLRTQSLQRYNVGDFVQRHRYAGRVVDA